MWKDHFIPSAAYQNSDLLKPHAFASDHVAMARVMLWYTCCLHDMKSKWDLAVMPSYNGQVYAPMDVDGFRIMKDSKNPDAAFQVLMYLMGEAAPDLIKTYGAFPARIDLQEQFLKVYSEKYPEVKHWNVVMPSFDYAVVPGQESYLPNFNKAQMRFADFATSLYGDTGNDIDVDKELDILETDLQKIIDSQAENSWFN